MLSKRIQNRICESRLLLPVSVITLVSTWWWPSPEFSLQRIVGLALCLFVTYVMMEMCNVNVIIRVYTRSSTALFVLLLAAMGMLHHLSPALCGVAVLAMAYALLMRADVVDNLVAHLFHTYVLLGVGMLFVPGYIVFAPMFYWYCIVYHRRLTGRAFWGGFIGLLLPFWVAICICWLCDDWTIAKQWWQQFTDVRMPSLAAYTAIPASYIWGWGVVAVLAFAGGYYYLTNSFRDKVRTRMLMYIFITQCAVIGVAVLVQPHWAQNMLLPMVFSAMPPVAHYFTLRHTTWGTTCMWLLVLYMLLMTWATCWPQSMGSTMEWIKQGAFWLWETAESIAIKTLK